MSEQETASYNLPLGLAAGVIFGGGCLLIWSHQPFWALALLAAGLGLGALCPKRSS